MVLDQSKYTLVGKFKSNGSANGNEVFRGPNGGLSYINSSNKRSSIRPSAIETSVVFNGST